MPSFIAPGNIDDLVKFTLPKVNKGKWTDVTPQYTNYVSPEILGRKDLRDDSGGSDQYTINLQIANDDNFREFGIFDEDRNTTGNNGATGYVRYAMYTTNWMYDIMETWFNAPPAQIVKVIDMRVHGMYTTFFERMEQLFFTDPAAPSSLTDNWPLLGFPHWVQKGSADAVSLQGGNPTGWAAGAGNISSTTYSKWKNVAGRYKTVDRADFIRKLSACTRATNWTPPHKYSEAVAHGKANMYHYCGETLLAQLEEYLEASNDNLGTDVLRYMDALIVKGAQVKRVPILDAIDTSNPFYSINLKSFQIVYPTGRMENKWGPLVGHGPNAGHNSRMSGFDTVIQNVCLDRRMNSVLSLSP